MQMSLVRHFDKKYSLMGMLGFNKKPGKKKLTSSDLMTQSES